ncbi:unnamed protein product, partial [Discosporangium mesarthrocarpum]
VPKTRASTCVLLVSYHAKMATITPGAIAHVISNSSGISEYHPIVQVVSIKKMSSTSGSASERYRLVLSDGKHFTQSMLATQQNSIITEGSLREGCLIRMQEFIVNLVQGKKLIIVLSLDVVSEPRPKIGNPVSISSED